MRTVLFCYCLCSLTCASVMAFQWKAYRKRYEGLGLWSVDFALQFLGICFIMLRGIIPDILTISVGNAAISLGLLFMVAGIRAFFGLSAWRKAEWAVLALSLAANAWFAYGSPDLRARNIAFSLMMVFFCGRGILDLARLKEPSRLAAPPVITVLAFFCLISAARIILDLRLDPGADFLASGSLDSFALIAYMGLFISLTFALAFMVGRRNFLEQERLLGEKTEAEAAMRASEEMLRKSFDASPNAVSISTFEDGRFLEINERFCKLLGYSREEVLGDPPIRIWARPEDRKAFTERFRRSEYVSGHEASLTAKDGREVHVEFSACLMEAGGRTRILSIIRSLEERDRAAAILRARLVLHEFAIGHSMEEVMVKALDEIEAMTHSSIGFYHFVEEDGARLSLQAWSTMTKAVFCKAEGSGMHYGIEQAGVWADCVRERRAIVHNDYASLPGKKGMPAGHAAVTRELVVPTFRDGKIVAILGVGNKPTDYDAEDVDLVSYIADLIWRIVVQKRSDEEISKLNERLEKLAMTDELTGIANRRAFYAVAVREFQKSTRYGSALSFIMVDIDFFKRINDTYGHETGDAALKAVADALRTGLREVDLLARLGGEEFGILLPSTKLPDAVSLAKRLLESIERLAVEVRGEKLSLTACLGVAERGGKGDSLEDLMREADKAMYRAKEDGRDRVATA